MGHESQAGRVVQAGNAIYVGPATTTTQAPAPVPNALNGLDNQVARMHERLAHLEQRLNIILAPLPPTGVGEAQKMARHSLALQIEAATASLTNAGDRLDSLIERLEL